MFNHKYISLKQVVDDVMRGRLYKELPFESAINYGVEAYRLLASEKSQITKPGKIEINNHRGRLPADLETVLQTVVISNNGTATPMRYATDNFNSILHSINSPDLKNNSELTYSLNANYIQTSFPKGNVLMVYKGLMTDEDCIPMIPDNVNVILAVRYYIRSKFLEDLGSDDPKINRQQEMDEQQYCWYIGKAQSSMSDLSIDEYETFANSMSQMFTENEYNAFMKNLGNKEIINIQRYG